VSTRQVNAHWRGTLGRGRFGRRGAGKDDEHHDSDDADVGACYYCPSVRRGCNTGDAHARGRLLPSRREFARIVVATASKKVGRKIPRNHRG